MHRLNVLMQGRGVSKYSLGVAFCGLGTYVNIVWKWKCSDDVMMVDG